MSSPIQIAIIGGGIVGLATGLELATRFPGMRLVVIEKEPFLAGHQTSHNSGVIHSGIYYRPGSFKARLCVEGAAALLPFCQEHTIPFETCGKVIVATEESELPRLEEFYRRGNANGLKGLQMLMAQQIREIEPHASGIRGIQVPGTSIVDYRRVAEKFGELITRNGGTILLSHEVIALGQRGSDTIIETTTRSRRNTACDQLRRTSGTFTPDYLSGSPCSALYRKFATADNCVARVKGSEHAGVY
jgi:L-2-hydroxyglutarate oxidase